MKSLVVLIECELTPSVRYAVEVLCREMGKLDVAVVEAGTPDGRLPSLTLKIDPRLKLPSQGFKLAWEPSFDPNELLDPAFSFSANFKIERQDTGISLDRTAGTITGADEAGLLYGVIEFIERCQSYAGLPTRPIKVRRGPKLEFRSVGLLLMKGGSYLNSINDEQFPWFYDKDWWIRALDRLALSRWNAVTLWNFHPFPFFCPIPGFPEVQEVDQRQLAQNSQMLHWLRGEFKRRNMTLLFHFYNIYVCRSFAKAHGVDVTLPKLSPLIARYMRAAISSFVNAFPQVGLVACVGEGVPGGEAEKFSAEVLLEGIKQTPHRPMFILRQWTTLTPERTKENILGKYDNLLTMMKHNAEHIAGAMPDARVRDWVDLGVPNVVNMHMLSEVDPFRWAPPSYIRQCCLNYQALGVRGVHVYARWSWRIPGVGDKGLELDEIDRDWLHYEAWGRYAFEPVRDQEQEQRYWINRCQQRGMTPAAARAAMTFYEGTGSILPRLQQHLWMHYDNHFVLTAGATLGQLRLARSMHGRKIILTDALDDLRPLRFDIQDPQPDAMGYHFSDAVERSATEADEVSKALDNAQCEPGTELDRLRVDAQGISLTVDFYRLKSKAAREIYQYGLTGDLSRLESAIAPLRQSVKLYERLTRQMERWYEGITDVPPLLPVSDYHASHRMPFSWSGCLPLFRQELKNVEMAHHIARSASPWSACYFAGVYDDDQIPQLVRQLTDTKESWLLGNPDFLPWPWNFDRLERLLVMPSNTLHISAEFGISLIEAIPSLRQWLQRGGRLTFYTHPDYRWQERIILSRLLKLPYDQPAAKPCQINGQRLVGLTGLPGDWNWHQTHQAMGISGGTNVGQGQIEIVAIAAP